MCGITGYFSFENDFNPLSFSKANNIIRHRGPDDFGYVTINNNFEVNKWSDENLKDFAPQNIIGAFGFRRLSIIDLSKSGNQPMADVNERYWIIFNGEIYNYIELKKELEVKGYKFKSNTDTEVILNAYHEWGINCLTRFNGMWAFSIFDKKEHKLFCSRDRLGIKPFYYKIDRNRLGFSSEIKQLLELFPLARKLNPGIVFDFLARGTYGNETPETYFNDIFKLSPGCYFELNLNIRLIEEIKEVRWWDLPKENNLLCYNDEQVFESISNLLEDSIRIRLRSDVPVGTALSGGLDSSGIVAFVNKILNKDAEKNKVFTINTIETGNDDPYYTNIIIDKIPVSTFKRDFEEYANINDLEKFIWHQEEPLQTASIFGSWQLYKFIREMGITVALDGQGADELMGGYYRYPFRKYLIDIIKNYGINYYLKQTKIINEIYKTNKSELFYNTILSYLLEKSKKYSFYYSRKLKTAKEWLNESFYETGFKDSHLIKRDFYDKKINFSSFLKKESYELIKHTNLPGILRQVDRNSMAFSVESRLPFLDYRLVEFLYSLPVHYMIRDGYTKFAYRMAMKDLIPNEVLWRKTKIGFQMPEYEILKGNKAFIKENINSLSNDLYVNTEYANKMLDLQLENKGNYDNIIWRILSFAIWKNKFNIE